MARRSIDLHDGLNRPTGHAAAVMLARLHRAGVLIGVRYQARVHDGDP